VIIKAKALAYITKDDRLLVFSHPLSPEAGIQVPGGTIQPGEEAAAAAMREGREETGLQELSLESHLGQTQINLSALGIDEIHQRDYFHIICQQETAARWRHDENFADDGSGPIPLEHYWVKMPLDEPLLTADLDEMLPRLYQNLNL